MHDYLWAKEEKKKKDAEEKEKCKREREEKKKAKLEAQEQKWVVQLEKKMEAEHKRRRKEST